MIKNSQNLCLKWELFFYRIMMIESDIFKEILLLETHQSSFHKVKIDRFNKKLYQV